MPALFGLRQRRREEGAAERLARLAISAPPTMREVRSVLRSAVDDIRARLKRLEKEFYNGNKPDGELRKWCNNAHALMRHTRVTWIQDTSHVDAIVKRALTDVKAGAGVGGGMIGGGGNVAGAVSKLRETIEKTLRFVPTRLEEERVLGDAESVLKYLQMYCHSVYNPADDPPIKAAADYEARTLRWAADVRRFVEHVRQLQMRFVKGTLYLEEMTQGTRELAMKSGSDDVVCMFVFHDAAECVRAACDTLDQWLDFADGYDGFLQLELGDACALRDALQAERRALQDAYNAQRYRQASQLNEAERLGAEVEAAAHKESELLVGEELLLSRVNDLQLDRDIAQFRLGELQRQAADLNRDVFAEKLSELQAALRDHDERLPALQKELDAVRARLARIDDKRQRALAARQELQHCKVASLDCLKSYQSAEREHAAACAAIELIRQIRLYLSTEGVPQKICLGLPRKHTENVKISRVDVTALPESKMDDAIEFLVHRIGTRWTEFYHHLPYFPPRGIKTLESDVIAIQSECVRDPIEGTVRKCLEFWLRHHTRARVSDLRAAIASFCGDDKQMLKDFDDLVDTKPPPPPEEEHIPASLDKNLVPYYRAICRYDRLRAAHNNPHRAVKAA